jgi:hypothetical protein
LIIRENDERASNVMIEVILNNYTGMGTGTPHVALLQKASLLFHLKLLLMGNNLSYQNIGAISMLFGHNPTASA